MRALILTIAIALTACPREPRVVPTPPPIPVNGDDCEKAEARLVQLNCAERVTPDGEPFATFCHDTMGFGVDLRPDCIAVVASCDKVGAASRSVGLCVGRWTE